MERKVNSHSHVSFRPLNYLVRWNTEIVALFDEEGWLLKGFFDSHQNDPRLQGGETIGFGITEDRVGVGSYFSSTNKTIFKDAEKMLNKHGYKKVK